MKLLSIGLIAKILVERGERKVVLCHGCYDVFHPGHVQHLSEAKRLGDVLVVTVTPDKYVSKGEGRPIFNQQKRAEVIAAIGCVDYVAVNLWPTAVETIRLLRPDVYVKGPECRTNKTPELIAELSEMAAIGGDVEYTSGEVFSSTAIIERIKCF